MSVKKVSWAVGLGMACILMSSAQAVQVNFQGALVDALPCSINNDQLIEVDFGDGVIIRNVDGVRYSEPVPYQIVCSAPGTVRLSVNGTPTHYDGAAIQTDAAGLGIHLTQAGQPFTLNTPIAVDPSNPPVLMAVPVSDPALPPSPGAFTAGATLLAEYQ
ncbi:fimbrial protein [Serratia fonticola]|uniref:fimbrial protein n=1 Tax=Serratia fonticola TaxID=47917 RepID=UPI0015C5AD00|nr:fimbrial protein [Serratia fonticola]MBC3379046.1 fimbrial protein [Serratia fonticola]NYA38246.1 fimbrial protein [Serratia fonticola]